MVQAIKPQMETPLAPEAMVIDIHGKREDAASDLPLLVIDSTVKKQGEENRKSHFQRIFGNFRFPVLLAIVLIVGAVSGLYYQPHFIQSLMSSLNLEPGAGSKAPFALPRDAAGTQRMSSNGSSALPPVQKTIIGLGKLLPLGELVTIAPPFGAGDARIATLKVKEGDRAAQGDVLAVLDNERSLLAAAEASRTVFATKQAMLTQVRDNVASSRDEARATVARTQATLANAKRDFDRISELRNKGFAAESNFDQKRAALNEVIQDVEKARATLSRYDGISIDEQPDILVARMNLNAAQADLDRATADLEKAYVKAPGDGTVLAINARPGEKPGAEGIFNFGNIDQMMAEIEIYQTLIGGVNIGAPVSLSGDALSKPLLGVVSRIGLEVRKQSATDVNPAALTDARVVKVYVQIKPESLDIARRFTNLQVTARISSGIAE